MTVLTKTFGIFNGGRYKSCQLSTAFQRVLQEIIHSLSIFEPFLLAFIASEHPQFGFYSGGDVHKENMSMTIKPYFLIKRMYGLLSAILFLTGDTTNNRLEKTTFS